ncbi:MAG: translation factor Sua5 [Herbaspirillum sp.]|jgi:L-threonylcarbamoyladenylate synthase|nr:translation factor Sua5 [Herbaspirillum sp.]
MSVSASSTLPPAPDVAHAARLLEGGRLVAFPTETVYGLGGDAENAQAVADIYAAKGRPANHPVIVHIAPEADVAYWVAALPPQAQRLIDAFWPGPLTLILPRAAHIPAAVSGGQETVAVRCPSHPVAQALLREFKQGRGGLAGPSANKFGHVSPTTAQHVRDEFGTDTGLLAYILDGGQSEVGIESTILDVSRIASHGAVLLRPGQIAATQIAEVLGAMPAAPDSAAPRASGTLDAHYAPATPVVMVDGERLHAIAQQLLAAGKTMALIHYRPAGAALQTARASHALPAHDAGYAHGLYAALRTMDAAGADVIVVEAPPAGPGWQGVNDRLHRASFDSKGALALLISPKK